MRHQAGDRVETTITYLEMTARPTTPLPHLPPGPPAALIAAERPPVWYFLALYQAVGADYEWTDQHERPQAELEEVLHHPEVTLFTLHRAGWPHGFCLLDWREPGICNLAYFGLVPQAIGRGLGRFLLANVVRTAWDHKDVEKLTVSTNTLDHPRALTLYQQVGFVATRRETRSQVLTRDRDLIGA